MPHARHGLYILLFVVSSWHLRVASGARPNRFYTIASKIKTDKVDGHHYEVLYDKYLQPIAGKNLRLLEGKVHSSAVGPALTHSRSTMVNLSLLVFCSGTWLRHALWPGPLSAGKGMRRQNSPEYVRRVLAICLQLTRDRQARLESHPRFQLV